jgi:hypothetical protein
LTGQIGKCGRVLRRFVMPERINRRDRTAAIRQRRLALGLTQKEVGERAGISAHAVWCCEHARVFNSAASWAKVEAALTVAEQERCG